MKSNPKVSVVIPVYNTEKFLSKCLDSVIKQTYSNLEIICVNDFSKDGCESILQKYKNLDSRIKIVKNEVNKGLYQTRIVGSKVATGEYICFLDSDDYWSIDWIRLLVKKALEEESDIVIGNTVNEKLSDGSFVYNNYISMNTSRSSMYDSEAFNYFMNDAGLNFSIHTVWNKLYTKQLWDTCLLSLEKLTGHLIMTEDVAFSLVLFYYCKKLSFSNHDAYFYVRHDEASTSTSISKERILKNLNDVVRVFVFFKNFLLENKIYEKYEKSFLEYRTRSFRIWCNVIDLRKFDSDKEIVSKFCKGMGQEKLQLTNSGDFYYYNITTPWNLRYEYIKTLIANKKIKVISFDLFDTLICRNILNPENIFDYYVAKYSDYLNENHIMNFISKRREAENYCRQKLSLDSYGYEDCTLTEIYDSLSELFGYSKDVTTQLMNFEKELDFELCTKREDGIELFELAKFLDKKISITSDIYYEKPIIEEILEKNNIKGYDALLISSEERALKGTGTLFNKLLETFKDYKPEEIMHIGDNWNSDYIAPKGKGLNSYFFGTSTGLFEAQYNDLLKKKISMLNLKEYEPKVSIRSISKQLPMNGLQSLVKNKFFNYKNLSYNAGLTWNANSYFIGYYALGTELFGIANWIYKKSLENNYKKIIFFARDGYAVKKVFDVLSVSKKNKIDSGYFYISRHSILSLVMYQQKDVSVIQEYIMIERHSPKSIISYVDSDYVALEDLKRDLSSNGIDFEKTFLNQRHFESFCNIANKYVNFDKMSNKYIPVISKIKDMFTENVASFDIGYSGRIQAALCKVLEKPVDVFFVHSNGYESEILATQQKFKIHNFFNYSPKVSSTIREYFYSELAPSCIGYKVVNKKLKPILEEKTFSVIEKYIISEMHRGAVDFANDYVNSFKEDFMYSFRNDEIAVPFELFINNISDIDMYTYSECKVEDSIYSNFSEDTLSNAWHWHMDYENFGIKRPAVGEKLPVQNAPTPSVPVQTNPAAVEFKIDTIYSLPEYKKFSRKHRAMVQFAINPKQFFKKLFKKNKDK